MQCLLHSLEETLIDLLQLAYHRKERVSWYVMGDAGGCLIRNNQFSCEWNTAIKKGECENVYNSILRSIFKIIKFCSAFIAID